MKKLSFLLLAVLTLAWAGAAWADDTDETAEATSPPAKKHGATIEISTGEPVNKALLEKLTPDQIFSLEMAKHKEDIPGGAPMIVAIVFGFPVMIVAVISFYRHRRNAMLHRTLAAMIDKGVPIPPELLQPEQQPPKPRSDLRRGLVLCAVGLGVIVGFAVEHDNSWGWGFIPLLIGVGYLVAWKLEQRKPNG